MTVDNTATEGLPFLRNLASDSKATVRLPKDDLVNLASLLIIRLRRCARQPVRKEVHHEVEEHEVDLSRS